MFLPHLCLLFHLGLFFAFLEDILNPKGGQLEDNLKNDSKLEDNGGQINGFFDQNSAIFSVFLIQLIDIAEKVL